MYPYHPSEHFELLGAPSQQAALDALNWQLGHTRGLAGAAALSESLPLARRPLKRTEMIAALPI